MMGGKERVRVLLVLSSFALTTTTNFPASTAWACSFSVPGDTAHRSLIYRGTMLRRTCQLRRCRRCILRENDTTLSSCARRRSRELTYVRALALWTRGDSDSYLLYNECKKKDSDSYNCDSPDVTLSCYASLLSATSQGRGALGLFLQ